MHSRYSFALLAPIKGCEAETVFDAVAYDPGRYRRLLHSMQALRGESYLEDGAIGTNEVDHCGRFVLPDDEQCWHLLLIDEQGEAIGCVRLRVHERPDFEDLNVKHAALAHDAVFGPRVRAAIEADLKLARENGLKYTEIGGWALAKEFRATKAALDILAASYALGELWGGSLGVATATFRHGSASILKKMGAQTFVVEEQPLPPYEDPRYGCMMELLRFTRTPAQRFSALVQPLKTTLQASPVVNARVARTQSVSAAELLVA